MTFVSDKDGWKKTNENLAQRHQRYRGMCQNGLCFGLFSDTAFLTIENLSSLPQITHSERYLQSRPNLPDFDYVLGWANCFYTC